MKILRFNKRHFFQTILIFLTLTVTWSFICVQTDEFTGNDKGLISGLGYLVLFSVSFYFGQPVRPFRILIYLTGSIIISFLISSFVLGALLGNLSLTIYAVVNSIFTAIVLTFILNKIYSVHFKGLTIILTIIFNLAAYLFMSTLGDDVFRNFDLRPGLSMFIIFQFMAIIPLTLGLTIEGKTAHNMRIGRKAGLRNMF